MLSYLTIVSLLLYVCMYPPSYSNGNILEGDFRLGKIHGHAVFRYPNGNQREGFFRENVLDGQVHKRRRTNITIDFWIYVMFSCFR